MSTDQGLWRKIRYGVLLGVGRRDRSRPVEACRGLSRPETLKEPCNERHKSTMVRTVFGITEVRGRCGTEHEGIAESRRCDRSAVIAIQLRAQIESTYNHVQRAPYLQSTHTADLEYRETISMLYVVCFTAISLASRTCLRKMNATNGTERPSQLYPCRSR